MCEELVVNAGVVLCGPLLDARNVRILEFVKGRIGSGSGNLRVCILLEAFLRTGVVVGQRQRLLCHSGACVRDRSKRRRREGAFTAVVYNQRTQMRWCAASDL